MKEKATFVKILTYPKYKNTENWVCCLRKCLFVINTKVTILQMSIEHNWKNSGYDPYLRVGKKSMKRNYLTTG